MMCRTSLLALVALLGCGGGHDARVLSAPVESTSSEPALEPVAARPRVIPRGETALEACLAPIDPIVFSTLGDAPVIIAEHSIAPRGPPLLDPSDPCEGQPSSVECAYREARIHFDQRRFDLAAKGFRKIALETEGTSEGMFAGQWALESMNIMGTYAEPARPECFDVIASDNGKLMDRYCQQPLRADREDSCFAFYRIARDLRRLGAEQLIKTADGGPPSDARPRYERAGDAYRSMFDDTCAPKTKKAALPRGCDEILFNAYRAYRAAGAREKAEAAYRTFFDPRFGLAETDLGKKLAAEGK